MADPLPSTRLPIILRAIILGEPQKRDITTAAKMLRIGRPALSNVLNGKSDLSIELAASIEDIFRYDALDLLGRQVAAKLWKHRREKYLHAPTSTSGIWAA